MQSTCCNGAVLRLGGILLLLALFGTGCRTPASIETENLYQASNEAFLLGEYGESERLCQEVLARAPEHVWCQNRLGQSAEAQGAHDRAYTQYWAFLEAARQQGDRAAEAVARNNLGLNRWYAKDHAAARDHLFLALELARAVGNTELQTKIHQNLALIYWELRDQAQAVSHIDRAISLAQYLRGTARNDTYHLWIVKSHFSLESGDLEGALDAASASVEAAVESGQPIREATARVWLGDVYWFLGDLAAADAEYRQALGLLRPFEHPLTDQVDRRREQLRQGRWAPEIR